MVVRVRVSSFAILLGLALAQQGCDDLGDYGGEFEGAIVEGNFVRSCFAADTRATLHFDPELAVGDVNDTNARNWLTTTDGTFQETTLEAISKLPDDQLSQFDFPGPRRLRNFLLLARPVSGPLQARDALIVISLLEDKRIEVRVIARTAETATPCEPQGEPGPQEFFGLFRLES